MAEAAEYSQKEIELHNSAGDAWMVIHGEGETGQQLSLVSIRAS